MTVRGNLVVDGGSVSIRNPYALEVGSMMVVQQGLGRVGVGTNSPAQKLHVFENADVQTFILSENGSTTGTGAVAVLRSQSDTASVSFQSHCSARTLNRWGVALGGWAEFLQVAGNGLAIGTFSGLPLILGTAQVAALVIDSVQNIGMGTSLPSSKLDVVGGSVTVRGLNAGISVSTYTVNGDAILFSTATPSGHILDGWVLWPSSTVTLNTGGTLVVVPPAGFTQLLPFSVTEIAGDAEANQVNISAAGANTYTIKNKSALNAKTVIYISLVKR